LKTLKDYYPWSVMKNKKILVTGATGLLGSWLTEKLLISGNEITGLALNEELDFLLISKKNQRSN